MAGDAFHKLMTALTRSTGAASECKSSLDEFDHAAAHLLPDDQVEARTARCRVCGAKTRGSWQVAHGGRRLRTPSEHTGPGGRVCDGSFQAADLRIPGKDTTR